MPEYGSRAALGSAELNMEASSRLYLSCIAGEARCRLIKWQLLAFSTCLLHNTDIPDYTTVCLFSVLNIAESEVFIVDFWIVVQKQGQNANWLLNHRRYIGLQVG